MPKIVDHDERRQSFALAAKQVIAEKGIESVRLIDVARAAGVTTGSLGHYFEAKDAVLDAALEHLVAEWDAQLEVAGQSFFEVLCRFLPLDKKSRTDCRVWIAFSSRALVSPEVAARSAAYWERYHREMSDYLHYVEGFEREEADTLAVTIQACVDGLMVRAVSIPKEWPAKRQRAQLQSMLAILVGPGAMKVPEQRHSAV